MLLCLALAATLPATAWAARAPYREGQEIEITGAVTDSAGRPLEGRTVVLEVYRRGFDLRSMNPRKMGSAKKGLQQRTVTTDEIGRYTLVWEWHDYYNRFEVSVGDFGPDGYFVEERADLSRRVLRGSPVIVSFVLGDGAVGAPEPDSSRSDRGALSAATGTSVDQARVRERNGAPDKTDSLELPYGSETTWWYFERGRAFRFLDGELRDELSFDPVGTL